jgi:hypothetical protein
VSLLLLLAYFHVIGNHRRMGFVFLACGLVGNFYILVFSHLFATLWVAEVFRAHGIRWRHLAYAALFAAGALPTFLATFSALTAAAPLDIAVMRLRHPYMMIFPLGPALATTLRRVLIYSVVTPVLAWVAARHGNDAERRGLQRWMPVLAGAAAVSVAGIIIENTTTLWPYHISRASVFFILAAMMVCAVGLEAAARLVAASWARPLAAVCLLGLLLVQSNLPSVYRHLRDLRDSRLERQNLLAAAAWLRNNTTDADRLLAPTSVDQDLALTLRAYALRPIYVSFKDGGISMLDGEAGQDWYRRLQRQQDALRSPDSGALVKLMRQERVRYAVLQNMDMRFPGSADVVHQAGHLTIIRLADAGSTATM